MTQSNLSLNQQLALALDYKSKGELAKAVVILEALINQRPENFNLNFQLGLLKCELGKVTDALVYFGNALLVKHVESKDYITIASVLSGHAGLWSLVVDAGLESAGFDVSLPVSLCAVPRLFL